MRCQENEIEGIVIDSLERAYSLSDLKKDIVAQVDVKGLEDQVAGPKGRGKEEHNERTIIASPNAIIEQDAVAKEGY